MTYNNAIQGNPPGSMTVANNVVIDKPNVADTRRGFKQFGTTLTTPIYKLFSFQDRLLSHHVTTLSYDSTGDGDWVDYAGTFDAITGTRIKSAQANQNFYFTTDNGIYKIDELTNDPYVAGGIAALDVTVVINGASGFLSNNSQCAYRITWVYEDANGNLIEGSPSMSTTLTNTSGSPTNASVTFTVPDGVTTDFYYRLYRTLQTGSTSIPPGDSFQLSYTAQPTAGEITAKSVTVTDTTVDLLLGTALYTNPGVQGEFQTNDAPPLAKDLCTFLGMMFYANCSTIQQRYITLISVGAPDGIQIGDTISFVGSSTRTYTGAAANNFASQEFKVDTSSTIAPNIDATARNLVSAINRDPSNTQFYAYYVSGFDQLPGQILIKARNLSQSAFSIISSRGGAFSPAIPSSGTSYISSNNEVKNGVYVSKTNQPEAVPTVNLIFVGSGSQDIFRVYPLRDAVVVESEGGVFRITGSSPSTLTVTPFDNTVIQFGIDTGVTLNNSVYSYATQGITSITESGSQIMSRNIEGNLLALSAPSLYPSFPTISFGISYESDRKYILALAAEPEDTVSTMQFVYNWITQAFTTWDLSITAGIVNPADNLLYLAGSDGQVLQERKSFTLTDYVDREYAVSIVSYSGDEVVLNSVANAVVGYSLAQHVETGSVELSSVITAIDSGTNTVTVEDELNWYTGEAAGLYQPINSTVTYTPLTCGYPSYVKRYQPTINFVFSQSSFEFATVGFSTDFYTPVEEVELMPKLQGGWGTFPWGTIPFGVSDAPLQSIPTFLTKNTSMNHWLNVSVNVNEAFQNLSLNGVSAFYDLVGERTR